MTRTVRNRLKILLQLDRYRYQVGKIKNRVVVREGRKTNSCFQEFHKPKYKRWLTAKDLLPLQVFLFWNSRLIIWHRIIQLLNIMSFQEEVSHKKSQSLRPTRVVHHWMCQVRKGTKTPKHLSLIMLHHIAIRLELSSELHLENQTPFQLAFLTRSRSTWREWVNTQRLFLLGGKKWHIIVKYHHG